MKVLAFSVYDEKVQAFNAPFFCQAIGQASRSFGDLVNDPQTTIHKHPEDYSLYHVGSFDDGAALFESQTPPALVGRGSDYVAVGGAPVGVERRPVRQDAAAVMRRQVEVER